ncbi:MAG: hypothetical protein ISR51_02315 [Rhodospirillales bacterium]|nr:hypothetical protein [Alphaproteobacteria bacterium]MBL6947487.1 hypothetical protein [Rhodospirillales bacterium]
MSDRMDNGPITFEILNAYVDGELDTASIAEVAHAVAEDGELAHQVAAISRLRSVLAESLDAPSQSMPDPDIFDDRADPLKASLSGRSVIAASIAFAMFMTGSILVSFLDRNLKADMMQNAWLMHQGWSIDAPAQTKTQPGFINADYIKALPEAYIPDLTAARLTLIHTSVKPISGNSKALLVGYRGTRGCKISLTVFPAPNSPIDPLGEEMSLSTHGNSEAYAWRAGSLGYVIMSAGMDSLRFRTLARSVHRTSRIHLPFDSQTRLALQKSRDKSAPCPA